jgi:hypothetical protein
VANLGASEAQLSLDASSAGRAPEIRLPGPDESRLRAACSGYARFSLELVMLVTIASVGAACLATIHYYSLLRSDQNTNTVVERIIHAESNGNPRAKSGRSSAMGAGQFIEQTWIEMIQRHRQDLVSGRNRIDLLELRGDPALTREIVARMVERNTKTLKKRGLPVTPGTLYLAHFAGSAGAVAVLTSADHLDAASLLAGADARGRNSREQLVKANPFLATFTVGDLKSWANRKMRG